MTKAFTTTLHDYLIQLPEAILDYPFGADIHVYKVESKIFAIYFKDDTRESINLKCDPVHAQELRAVFSEITPGYHMDCRLKSDTSVALFNDTAFILALD